MFTERYYLEVRYDDGELKYWSLFDMDEWEKLMYEVFNGWGCAVKLYDRGVGEYLINASRYRPTNEVAQIATEYRRKVFS